jgi:dCMP deaminase
MSDKDRETYLDILSAYEKRSTCKRVKVACVAVKSGRSVASGWNGVAAGCIHCEDHFTQFTVAEMQTTQNAAHRQFSIENEMHAEMNCIAFAAKEGISLQGADLYISYSPCGDCAKVIQAVGVARVFYKKPYDRDPEGKFVEYLRSRKIVVEQLM